MKKLLLTLLSVLMLCTLATTNVFAEDGSKETEVTYEAPSTYEWSVPQTLSISTEDSTLDVEVMNPSLAAGEKIKITVESANNFNVKNGSTSLSYKLAKDNKYESVVANNDVVVETVAGAQQGLQQQLHVKLSAAGTKAGKYSDTLTFTASVIKSAGLYNNGEFTTSWEQLLADGYFVETYDPDNPNIKSIQCPEVYKDCSDLTGELLVDSSLNEIGGYVLQGSNITSIIFPNGIDSIGYASFNNDVKLTSITIPSTVHYIAEYVFADCSNLSSITYQGTMTQWGNVTLDEGAFGFVATSVVHCTDGDVTLIHY